MKLIIFILFFITSFIASSASIPNNNFKIGTDSSINKGFEFNFGGDNPKLQILSADKSLNFDRDKMSIGSGVASGVKQLNFNGYDKSLSFETDTFKLDAQKLQVGDGTASSIDLLFNNGSNQKLRSNPTSGKLEFTNDGALFKSLGTGGGGGSAGILLVGNEGFEDGVNDQWTVAGGATVAEVVTGVDLGFDNKSAKVTYSAAGSYCSDLNTKPNALGFGCMASIYYKGGGTDHKVVVYDGSSNAIASLDLLASASWVLTPVQTFECTAQVKICVEGSSGDIALDGVYLGNNKNLVNVQEQAKFVGELKLTGGNCLMTANTSWQDTCAVAGTSISTSGNITSDGSGKITFTIPNAKKGRYKVVINGGLVKKLSDANRLKFKLYDSINSLSSSEEVVFVGLAEYLNNGTSIFNIDILSSGSYTFTLQTSTSTNTTDTYIRADLSPLVTSVYYYPDASQAAWYPEAQSFFISGDIGGANVNVPGATDYELGDANLSIILKNGSAKIACQGAEASSGSTCTTNNEAVGIVHNVPVIGRYKYCFAYGMSNGGGTNYYRLAETLDGSNTVIRYGDSMVLEDADSASHRLCSYFTYDSIGEKAIKLFVSGNGSKTIYADRLASSMARAISFSVELVSEGVNKPYVLNQVDTSVKGGVKVLACNIASDASIINSGGMCDEWVLSASKSGSNYTIAAKFDVSNYVCTTSAGITLVGSGNRSVTVRTPIVGSNVEYTTYQDTSGTDYDAIVTLICVGAR